MNEGTLQRIAILFGDPIAALVAAAWNLDDAWHGGADHDDEHAALCDALDDLLLHPSPEEEEE